MYSNFFDFKIKNKQFKRNFYIKNINFLIFDIKKKNISIANSIFPEIYRKKLSFDFLIIY